MENHYFVFIGKSINGPFSIATVCEFTGRQHHIAQFWVRNQRMMGSYSGGGFLFGLDCFTLPYVPGRCLVDRCYYVLLQSNKYLSICIYIYMYRHKIAFLWMYSLRIQVDIVYMGITLHCITGWCFGKWLLFSHILGMSSSQLTFIPSFFRGVGQPPTREYHN